MAKLKKSDLVGEMHEVKIMGLQDTSRDGITILNVENNGEALNVGVVQDDILDRILEDHGELRNDGKFLKVPAKVIVEAKEKKIGWINKAY